MRTASSLQELPQDLASGEGASDSVQGDEDILQEMKADAIRVLRSQADGIATLDTKAERVLALGVATLTTGAGFGIVLADRAETLPAFGAVSAFALLFLAVTANCAALGLCFQAYSGLTQVRVRGDAPNLEWLSKKSVDAPALNNYRRSVIDGFRVAFVKNSADSRILTRHRLHGSRFLMLALLFYVLAALMFAGSRLGQRWVNP